MINLRKLPKNISLKLSHNPSAFQKTITLLNLDSHEIKHENEILLLHSCNVPGQKITTKISQQMKAEIIQSQHCIRIDEDEIEIIYMIQSQQIQVFINAEIVVSSQLNRNPIQVNYSNLIETACQIYFNWLKQKRTKAHQDLIQWYREEGKSKMENSTT